MIDIILIQPPVRDFYLTTKRTIPYGLACIAAALEKQGFSVEIMDALAVSKSRTLQYPPEMEYLKPYYGRSDVSPFGLFHHFRHFGYSFEHIGQTVRKAQPFLVGISSLFTAYEEQAVETARTVKKWHPECKIVMGGHHATAMPLRVMDEADVDFILRGEGETSLPILAKCLLENGDLKAVPGIVHRKSDGIVHVSEPSMMVQPDNYPLPATHLINHTYYQRNKRVCSVVVTSRGCPMKCSYCCVGSHGNTYRQRSVDSVIQEMQTAVFKHNARFIDFEDENLSLNRTWFRDLLLKIQESFTDYPLELRAMNGLYLPSLDEEIIRLMKAAGFRNLNLSLATTDSRQLCRFHRPDVSRNLDSVLTAAKRYHLESVCYIIAGAPGQTADSSIADLIYLLEKEAIVGLSIFYPSPGSQDFKTCQSMGLLPEKPSLMRSVAFPISHVTDRTQSVTLLRLARIVNFIKMLRTRKIPIPAPLAYDGRTKINPNLNRMDIGLKILQWFLHDGLIKGVTNQGNIYDHLVSVSLTARFLSNLKNSSEKR